MNVVQVASFINLHQRFPGATVGRGPEVARWRLAVLVMLRALMPRPPRRSRPLARIVTRTPHTALRKVRGYPGMASR